jgi:hypothetical protein
MRAAMSSFPISQAVLGVIAILTAMEGGVSDFMVWVWAIGGSVVLSELIWNKIPWTRFCWPVTGKLLTCVALTAIVILGSFYRFIRSNIVFAEGNNMPFLYSDAAASWLRVKATNRGWREAHCHFFLSDLLRETEPKKQFFHDEAIRLSLGGGQEIQSGGGAAWESWQSEDDPRYVNLSHSIAGAGQMTVYSDQLVKKLFASNTMAARKFQWFRIPS